MPGCSVYNCSERTEKGIRLFLLPQGPKNSARRNEWIKNINRKDCLPEKAFVCEKHFTYDQFENNRQDNKRPLRWNAVPTLFSHNIPQPRKPPKVRIGYKQKLENMDDEILLSKELKSEQNDNQTLETSYNLISSDGIKTEEFEDVKYNLEDLHHSIDIKEENDIEEQFSPQKSAEEVSVKTFSCKVCDYKSACASVLLQHFRTHTGEKPFSCKICDYKCALISVLKRHLNIHIGEKPFSCELCDYKCRHKAHLQRHLKTHAGEKPILCKLCDYKCDLLSGLKRHLKIHTGEKPFTCEICDYKSAHKSALMRHLKIHTGEKEFLCEVCDFKCLRKDKLKLHVKNSHK